MSNEDQEDLAVYIGTLEKKKEKKEKKEKKFYSLAHNVLFLLL